MTLIDSNILLDFITEDEIWAARSRAAFRQTMIAGPVFIVDVIFSEISIAFSNAADCEYFARSLGIVRQPMSAEALWIAGQAFRRYRGHGGKKTNVLPDFFIGAQAQVMGAELLTRDAARYKTYFPEVRLVGV